MSEHVTEVIPVTDLMGDAVVRARHGSRHSYAPIVTPVVRTSAPLDVVAGFLKIHPFRTTYAADLDRIASRGSHEQSLDALSAAFPGVAFWVDTGVRQDAEARSWLARHKRAHLVLGSESLDGPAVLKELATDDRIVYRSTITATAFSGQKSLCDRRICARARDRHDAGAGRRRCGTRQDRLADIKRRAPDVMLYAAGGLRGASDLTRLKQLSTKRVLAASALHEGRLNGADLAAAASKDADE